MENFVGAEKKSWGVRRNPPKEFKKHSIESSNWA